MNRKEIVTGRESWLLGCVNISMLRRKRSFRIFDRAEGHRGWGDPFNTHLYHADDLTGRVFDRHAQHGGVPETGVFVHGLIETRVLVSVGDVDRLKKHKEKKPHN